MRFFNTAGPVNPADHYCHLVVLDRSLDKSWDDKLFRRQKMVQGGIVVVWGM